MPPELPQDDLERRHASARRLAWLLGLAVLAIYIIGLLIKR